VPVFKAGEVLIKVHAAGVNRPDVFQRMGNYAPPPGASDMPGLEVAGEIVDGDLDYTTLDIGDLVCALVQGRLCRVCCCARTASVAGPKGWSMLEAASSGKLLHSLEQRLRPCQTGRRRDLAGAGRQLRHRRDGHPAGPALGHRVFATAGSDDKVAACEALGAERGINYKTEDFGAVVKEFTNGRGVDVILDMVAGTTCRARSPAWPTMAGWSSSPRWAAARRRWTWARCCAAA
jgi:NADPH2:quinone reductase